MGNIMPGLDAEKKQLIEGICKEFLATFAAAYAQAYGVEVTRLKLKEIEEDSFAVEKKEKELQYRENFVSTDPLKMGTMIKQGAVVKNWKKRYFVIRNDYAIEYYENEEAFQKGFKPKGVIVPAGYKVEENADSAIAERLKAMAKRLGIDENDVPLPDKYADHTFELFHERRRPYYMTAESEEEKQEWIQVIKQCCQRSYGFKNPDPIAMVAFKDGFRVARRECGYYYASCRGSEEQILSDTIVGAIDHRVMRDVYSNFSTMPGGYAVRKKVSEQVRKSLDSLVMAMVVPSYKGQVETTSKMKTPLEEMIVEKKDDILGVQNKISAQMSEQFDGLLGDIVGNLDNDIDVLEFKVKDILKKCTQLLRENVAKVFEHVTEMSKDNDDVEACLPKYFKILDKAANFDRYSNKMITAYQPAYNVINTNPLLNDLSSGFTQTINRMGEDAISLLYDGAAYTFEELFKELVKGTDALKSGKTTAEIMVTCKDQVLPKLDTDIKSIVEETSFAMTREGVISFLTKKLEPLTKDLRKKLKSSVPDASKKVVSVDERYENYITKVSDDLVKRVLAKGGSTEANSPDESGRATPDGAAQETTDSKPPSTDL